MERFITKKTERRGEVWTDPQGRGAFIDVFLGKFVLNIKPSSFVNTFLAEIILYVGWRSGDRFSGFIFQLNYGLNFKLGLSEEWGEFLNIFHHSG